MISRDPECFSGRVYEILVLVALRDAAPASVIVEEEALLSLYRILTVSLSDPSTSPRRQISVLNDVMPVRS